jgi:hypothetical protein
VAAALKSRPPRLGISLREADAHTRLSTYLNDHLAGATGSLELARRATSSNRDNEYGEFLATLRDDIEQDRETLRDVMRRLAVREDQVKHAAAWTGEKLGRLKLNGQLLGHSPLSLLVELEGLSLGVTGKLCLWLALREAVGEDPRLQDIDFAAVATRARDQRQALERNRRRAAAEALT